MEVEADVSVCISGDTDGLFLIGTNTGNITMQKAASAVTPITLTVMVKTTQSNDSSSVVLPSVSKQSFPCISLAGGDNNSIVQIS